MENALGRFKRFKYIKVLGTQFLPAELELHHKCMESVFNDIRLAKHGETAVPLPHKQCYKTVALSWHVTKKAARWLGCERRDIFALEPQ